MQNHAPFMQRCIDLAYHGLGTTYPNPLVGSVIVHQGKIIGEGWHQRAGEPHAEVHAIASVKEVSFLTEATLYVNLEPCSHYGKTPPCAHLIVDKGIKRVVIGTTDPNPMVAGKGIAHLIAAGCEVIVGVLEDACNELNKRFFTFQQQHRPYILLKWAQTADGFIAPAKRNEQAPVWISNALSKQRSHQLRAAEQAILIGTQTAIDDDPSLTTRLWEGNSPIRIVLDKSLRIPPTAAIYDSTSKTIVITEQQKEDSDTVTYETIDFSEHFAKQICEVLYKHHIQSVIIEGGAQTLQTFIDAQLWDEAMVFEGKQTFVEGTKAPTLQAEKQGILQINSNQLTHFKPTAP